MTRVYGLHDVASRVDFMDGSGHMGERDSTCGNGNYETQASLHSSL